MNPALQRRLERFRSRAAVRAWEYRQRSHAKGAWFRLRRALAEAEAAYAVSPEDAQALIAEGFEAEPVGAEFYPPKTLLFVGAGRAEKLLSRRPIPLRLGADLLLAPALALVRFPGRAPWIVDRGSALARQDATSHIIAICDFSRRSESSGSDNAPSPPRAGFPGKPHP